MSIINLSNSEVRLSFGAAISTGRRGAFRIFDSVIESDDSIMLQSDSDMANKEVSVLAISDIRLLGSGNTIN